MPVARHLHQAPVHQAVKRAPATLGCVLAALCIAACSPPPDFVTTLFPQGGKVLDPKFAAVHPWEEVHDLLWTRLEHLRSADGLLGSFEVDGVSVELKTQGPRVRSVTFRMAPTASPSSDPYRDLVARWGPPDVERDPEGRAVWTGPEVAAAFGGAQNARPLVMAVNRQPGSGLRVTFAACALEALFRGPPGGDLSWPDGPLLGAPRKGISASGAPRYEVSGLDIEEAHGHMKRLEPGSLAEPVVMGYRARLPSATCPMGLERWRELLIAKWGEPTSAQNTGKGEWGLEVERDGLAVSVYDRGMGTTLEVVSAPSWEEFFAGFLDELDPARLHDPRCDQLARLGDGAVPCWRVIPGGPNAFARFERHGDTIQLDLTEAQADRLEAAAARLFGPRRMNKLSKAIFFDPRGILWEIKREEVYQMALISRRDPLETLVVLDEIERVLGLKVSQSLEDPENPGARVWFAPSSKMDCATSWRTGPTPEHAMHCSGGAFDHALFQAVDFFIEGKPRGGYELTIEVGAHLNEAAPGEAHQRLMTRAQALYGAPRTTATGSEFNVPDRPETLRIALRDGQTSVTWSVPGASGLEVPR